MIVSYFSSKLFYLYTVGDRTVALNIIARCSITQTPTGQWSIDKTDFTHAILKYDFNFMSWNVM